jgi:FAD/FMN-containing dehydrogenase
MNADLHEPYAQRLAGGDCLPDAGGAISTGTHGQGMQQSSLADEALAIRLIDAAGQIHTLDNQHPWFAAAQLGLGTLGAISAVTLRTRPYTQFTCFKSAHSADTLEQDLMAWNQQWTFSKAWWFVDENKVHAWNAREAHDDERQAWRDNHGDLLTLEETSDQMNSQWKIPCTICATTPVSWMKTASRFVL